MPRRTRRIRIALAALAPLVASASAQPAQTEAASPVKLSSDGLAVTAETDGQTLWRLNYAQDLTHIALHPLALPGVGSLTVDAPADHVHHHGLWFSWKYINGVNFWENAPGAKRPAGRTSWTPSINWLATSGNEASCQFSVAYSIEDTVVLTEARDVQYKSAADDGSYIIDWDSRFEAVAEEVKLDRTPLPDEPGGKVFGGYAGLSARLVQLDDRRVMTTDGPIEFNDQDRYRGRHDGFEYSGVLRGEEVGIAILSHPENVNSPSPWYAIRSGAMSFFTPAVICYEPLTLRKGDTFRLRYRVLVHPGRWSREQLEAAFREYAGPAPKEAATKYPEQQKE